MFDTLIKNNKEELISFINSKFQNFKTDNSFKLISEDFEEF
jgi:glutathionyl-hydroquinone reductase